MDKVENNPNILFRAKCYLIGSMENDSNGNNWRISVIQKLSKANILFLNPYDNLFINDIGDGNFEEKKLLRQNGNFKKLSSLMKKVRVRDLSLVDRCDFIIANFNPSIQSVGSMEEITTANRMKKPIFLNITSGIKNCPLWFFGMLDYKCFFSSLDDVVSHLLSIDNGTLSIDYTKWKLLNKNLR